jgi:proliferating cell nuclear antigen
MLEARLAQGVVLKKVVDSLRDLVNEANFEFTPSGITLQSMDSAHVILVSLLLRADGFESYRCDRTIPVGINMASFSKIIRSAANDDAITLRADDNGETLNLVFEAPNAGRVSDYELKLMDLDVEQVALPEMSYDVSVRMPSEELQRVCRDLSALSESVTIEASKDAVRFAVKGDLGSGSIALRSAAPIDKKDAGTSVNMRQPANVAVSLKFLTQFTKATALSDTVMLEFSNDCPMLIEYPIGEMGYIRFYLAPKVDDEDEDK